MIKKQDLILKGLLEKKRDLLSQLQILSMRFAIDGGEGGKDHWFSKRKKNLSQIMRNDQMIGLREKQSGISITDQESTLVEEINDILKNIYENNQQTIYLIEKNKKKLEEDRNKLKKGNQLSGYLRQMTSY
ncbi:MAG: hypothetical protein OEY59_04335 [Deltaproteobacteria bacterium]|nr:hypothetical protein [Deltaproteobacteria bacterium]